MSNSQGKQPTQQWDNVKIFMEIACSSLER